MALGEGEVLIAIADAGSVAVQRIRMPPGGSPSSLSELARRVAEIELIASEVARGEARADVAPPSLTTAEQQALERGGLDASPLSDDDARALHRTAAEYAALLHDSYTVDEAARLLGVNPSRIRQRLTTAPRTLYAIKTGKVWRVPQFQFSGSRLISGIATVAERLAPDLHPVAVRRWFMSPHADLTLDDGGAISPLDWLRIGNSPEVVAELAAGL